MNERDPGALKSLIAGFFDRAAPTYDGVAGSYFSILGPRLVDRIELREGATIVDVACGKGATLIPCAERAGTEGTVLGVDVSFEMVRSARAHARKRGLSNVVVAVMDGERLALRKACADAVVCGFSLHFFPNPLEAAAEFARVLSPGGTIALSEWGATDDRWAWEDELVGSLLVKSVSSGSFDNHEALEGFLESAEVTDIEKGTESVTVHLADEDEWWTWKWSYSFRYMLEQLDADARDRFQADALEHVRTMRRADGIAITLHALMAVGRKSR
ncbi:MAG: methyltransferase domain-containing protein [Actinobacteria bacterium]|nr:methyltransferase domain-containing protein [Actinomycetota bacterium]